VPPLVDLEFIIARLGCRFGVGAGAGIDFVLFFRVADENDSMIETCTTTIFLLYNTAFIELEGD